MPLVRRLGVVLALGALAASPALSPAVAHADVQHVVARGHTILSIAHRYHVPVKAILEANHLKDATHLKVGSTLTIPGATPPSAAKGKVEAESKRGLPGTYKLRPKTPGVVHATRLATNEDFTVRVAHRGHASPTALKSFERMMRNGAGLTHPIDPHLIALVGTVSDHFGSRRLEIVSGFRPYTTTQYTHHSNHNIGHAIDFRVVGVPNEVLRDYCRTLHNVGVGYYPNSTFVHLDVRTSPAFWIDYSRPGEPPKSNAPNVDADEGTSDVSDDGHPPEAAIAPDLPTPPPLVNGPTALPPLAGDAPTTSPTSTATPAPSTPSTSQAPSVSPAPSAAPAPTPSAPLPAPAPTSDNPAPSAPPTKI
jgi:uncharacterized protein YcbK (DUF882 family)